MTPARVLIHLGLACILVAAIIFGLALFVEDEQPDVRPYATRTK